MSKYKVGDLVLFLGQAEPWSPKRRMIGEVTIVHYPGSTEQTYTVNTVGYGYPKHAPGPEFAFWVISADIAGTVWIGQGDE